MSLTGNTRVSKDGFLRPILKPFERPLNLRSRIKELLSSLSWKQWLVLFASGAFIIIVEVRNHIHMWQEHQSGQTILSDPELIWEIGVYGIFMPILVGLLFGHLERTAAERDKVARELALRRDLVNQVQGARNWPELVELVVATPGRLVPADRAWLYVQRSRSDELEPIAHWERFGTSLLPSSPPVSPTICERCMAQIALKKPRIVTCHDPHSSCGTDGNKRYCLWLSVEDRRKAALQFDVPVDLDLAPEQLKMLDELGAEMALAIENANLQYLEQRQVDAAKDERLRIARDLHDTLGQNVSFLRLKLEQLSSTEVASNDLEFQGELANMLAVADEAYEQVRDALDELRSTQHSDLEESAWAYANQVAARNKFTVSVHSNGSAGTLTRRQLRQTMYILREALNNVEKHADAQNVDIYLKWHDSECTMTIRDDGRGFSPKALAKTDSFGMSIMRERSRAMNADLIVTSLPSGGTEVTLRLPLSPKISVAQSK